MSIESTMKTRARRFAVTCAVVLSWSGGAVAFELVADLPSPQLLGTTVHWQVVDAPPGEVFDYRLKALRTGAGETSHVLYDYSPESDFEWTPMQEGLYIVTAVVRDDTGQTTTLNVPFSVTPRATDAPVVSPTRNSLVALYSAPACAAGRTMEVTFRAPGVATGQTTNRKSCDGNLTMNFLIAGMRLQTTYNMRHVLRDAQGAVVAVGPIMQFTTGVAQPGLPTVTVVTPPGPATSFADDVFLVTPNSDSEGTITATDLNGNLIWYYTGPDQVNVQMSRIHTGGHIFMIAPAVSPEDDSTLREVDLASNVLRETNAQRVSERLRALGQPQINAFTREIRPLANGHIIVIGATERILVDQQGPGPVDVLGDMIIDLDTELQPVWASNLFDVLDVTRVAVLGETCVPLGRGCPPVHLADVANDWTHCNSVAYSPADGNLIVSSRHQDWVFKLDYRDGLGTGGLVWRFGREGDFTLESRASDGWQSHQHDANYLGNDEIIMYDNGNAHPDCIVDRQMCVSAGKVYRLEESTMTATPVLNATLNNYSFALGAAQRLSNGNYHFNSGAFDGSQVSRSQELSPEGDIIFELEVSRRAYRSFRLRDLYTPPQY
jgi:arylsulfate sulfotransferase